MYRRIVAASTAAAVTAALLVATPAAAQDTPGRSPQPYDSTPVEPVSGAESAFEDAAANWSGDEADPVGASGSGDWTATDLSHAGSWVHGGSSGAFSYAYGMRIPPAAGPAPELALSYSSASHDGRTSGTNNQASWVGDGWSYGPSFIERTYTGCADDDGGNQGEDPTGDLCWEGESPSITMSLGGVTTSLVRDDDSGDWRAEDDLSWRIEHLGSPAIPGGTNTERWVITGPDGTAHHFASRSSSRLTMPVFGNHSGEPCYSSGDFEGSRCHQAYRWMLDKSVDVHGNLVRYTYQITGGRYAPAADQEKSVSYIREAWLKRIEYGLREGSSAPATAKVEFTVADRCLSDCRDGDGDPKHDSWPDTPWDLHCEAGEDCETYSPTFFATKRLTKIATYVADGTGGYDEVDSWALTHEFKDYGDEEQVVLWLAAVRHTGHVGGSESLPSVEFGGTFLPNRVDAGESWPGIWRPRLTSIKNETGGVTTINYSEPDCGQGDLPARDHQNNRRCYPMQYEPEGLYEPVDAYFHKYVVRSVVESDATGGGDAVWTFYDYSTAGGGTSALWAWNDAEFVDKEARDWNQWRGYAQVTTRTGDPADPDPQLRSRTRFFRGMDDDKLPDGGKRSVTVTDSQGNSTTDHRALAGMEWESAAFNGTTIIASTTTWYRWSRTAVRTYDGGKLEAFQTGPKRTDSREKLSDSAWRHSRTDTSYDRYGRAVEVDETGDRGRSGDERCVRTTYTDNTEKWLMQSVAAVEAVSVGCSATPDRPADVIGAARAYYDGHDSHTAAPSRGLLTRTDALEEWDGGPVYVTLGESTYDSLGREVVATDAFGESVTTTYTPSGAGPVTQVATTNALGHTTTTRLEPAWGTTIEEVTPNGAQSLASYDPLGRRTAVWLPGRDPAKGANLKFSYQVSQTEPTTVATQTMLPDESYRTEIELYDSLLRHRQTQAETYGGRLISQTVYDSYGRTRFSSEPVFNNDSGPTGELMWVTRPNDVARTELSYDAAGRVTAEAFFVKGDERWRTSYRYGGHDEYWLTTTVAPQGGTSTAALTDAWGRPAELRQYHQRAANGEFDATRYDHGPDGNLAQVTDPAGNSWEFEYDLRGRRVAVDDPDTGTTTTTYNPAGQITSTVNGNGTRLSPVYDELGRPTQVWEGTPDSGELLIERTYDAATNGIGRPHTATRYADGQAWRTEHRKYDTAGRPTQVYTDLPEAAGELAGRYWQSFAYYPDGSLLKSNAIGAGGLAREPMTYYYNELGQPDRVTSSGDDFGEGHVYVDDAVYSPYGQLLQRRLGDPDEVGGSSGQVWQTWVYEEGTGRLAEFYFDKDTPGDYDGADYGVAALSYEYDDAGNILSISDDPVHTAEHLDPETQCFEYDYLRRLTEAWAQAGAGDCAATPVSGVVGGPGAYWSSYEYDEVGNRVAETRWQPDGSSTEQAYNYGQDGPHSLASVTGDNPATLSYDAAGYTTAIDRDGEIDALTWDTTGRLDTIETDDGTARFFDDAAGNRLLRSDPNGDLTAWVAGYELTYNAATGATRATRYYQHGGETIGVRNGRGDIQWLASDHHGTNHWVVNGDTLTTKVRRFDPFGNERGAGRGIWPDQRGFVGGITNEDTGLTTVGAREYDPELGRFLSRDPITDFTDPQQINGYSYASNNPVVFSDATGLRETECSPGPCRSAGGRGAGASGATKGPGARKGPGNSTGTGKSAGGRSGKGRNTGPGGYPPRGDRGGPSGPAQKGPKCGGDGVCEAGPVDMRPPKGIGGSPGLIDPGDFRLGKAGVAQMGPPRITVDGNEVEAWLQQQFAMYDVMWTSGCAFSPHCPGYVRDNPPGAVGVCLSGSGSYVASASAQLCVWYTREDGIVYSGTLGAGGGIDAGADVAGGLFVTSASSADEIRGGGWTVNLSGELIVGLGLSGGMSDSGEWTVGGEVSLGVGSPMGGTVEETETGALTHEEAEVVWKILRIMPLVPW